MATNDPTRTSSAISRRAALRGTAALGAAVLPASAAMAARPIDLSVVDPGLVQLEAGYARWCELLAERDRLQRRRDRLLARSEAIIEPLIEPHPEPHPDIVPYVAAGWLPRWEPGQGRWQETPEDRIEAAQQYIDAVKDWRARRNDLLDDQPDYRRSRELDERAEDLDRKAEALRLEIMATRTTSPRGVLLKVAVATDTSRLDDMDKRFARPVYYGTFDDCHALMPGLLADLRAMAAGGVA